MVLTNVAGDLSFTDLDLYADGGTGLRASGTTPYTGSAGFQVAVASGVATITAAGGPAVDVTQATVNLPFNQISSTNSAVHRRVSRYRGRNLLGRHIEFHRELDGDELQHQRRGARL